MISTGFSPPERKLEKVLDSAQAKCLFPGQSNLTCGGLSFSISKEEMKLDPNGKKAVRELGDAINAAIEKSSRVSDAIEQLRELGYEPHLNLKLEIGLQEAESTEAETENEVEEGNFELELTDEDLRTLRRMKIKF